MRVVVQDASVLIDLGAAELLDAWFSLEIETLTTSLVWREVNRRSQKARMRPFARDERIQVVAEFMKPSGNVAFPDLFAEAQRRRNQSYSVWTR